MKKRLAVLMLALAPAVLQASSYLPEVYRDEYVTVRAGVPEIGSEPIHIGDPLSLVVEAEYVEGQVVLEELDEELFTRAFGAEKGISLLESPAPSRVPLEAGQVRLSGAFRFQIVDCPGELPSCPGHKSYELPVITLGYQIINASGEVLNNKSMRFRPWPGAVNVTQALPVNMERPGEFKDYFPAGGYPPAQGAGEPGNGGLWTAFFGGLIIISSFAPLLARERAAGRVDVSRASSRRWQRALAALEQDGRLSDEEWSDLLRRSLTWYSLDELGENPYDWLIDGHETGSAPREFRDFFLEVLDREGVAPAERPALLARFDSLTRANPARAAA